VVPLADMVIEVLRDPDRLTRLSRENLLKGRAYHADVLRPRRRDFYKTVLDATLRWQAERRGSDS
jgi:hypothetical protein